MSKKNIRALKSAHRLAPRLCALAAALALTQPAWADAVVSGELVLSPGSTFAGGAGDFLYPGQTLWVGLSQAGQLSLNGASMLQLGQLSVASGFGTAATPGLSTAVVSGAQTLLQLQSANTNRLGVGDWGMARLTVESGAQLDARSAACTAGCGTFIGNAAGSDGMMTVTGAGTQVQLGQLFMANASVYAPPASGFTYGTPGGITQARLNVLDGASLLTTSATVGAGPNGTAFLGTERTFADVVVSGAGSTWRLAPLGTSGVSMNLSQHANATSTLTVNQAGTVRIEGPANQNNSMVIGLNGRADATVSGAGSKVEFAANTNGVLHMGRNAGSQGSLTINNGGQLTGVWYTGIGRDGATGSLTVDGAGSLFRADGNNVVAAAGGQFVSSIDVARNGGTGTMNVRNGGRVEVLSTLYRSGGGPGISVGRDAGSTGTLNISGANSVVQLQAASVLPGGGVLEAFNPTVTVGRLGTGTLNVTGGGKLLIDGNAVSMPTPTTSRTTALRIGGTGDTNSGGNGTALVSGLGSEIAVRGSDAFLAVGLGTGANGSLTVADQAVVRSTIFAVGRSGGTGMVNLNGGSVYLSGQQTGNNVAGASLSLGTGGSNGVMTMSNGALLRVDNASGNVSSGVTIGGSSNFLGGSGVLSMSSGSRIEVNGPAGLSGITVGRDGSGVLSMSASHIDVGATGALILARNLGSTGSMTMTNGSTLNAQYVGVGRNRLADGSTEDGGVASLVINSGSVINAGTLEIGRNGYLGGIGTIVGNVVNHGVFNPGNSPGTMIIDGGYTAGADGKLILEVGLDANGNFITDQVIFTPGTQVNLAGMDVEFKFLGAANPVAFNAVAGRFDIDTFLKQQVSDGSGGVTLQALDDSLLATTTFTAAADGFQINNFSFTVAGGAGNFTAAPVPEPGTWAMMAAGLLSLSVLRRRRRA